MSDNLGYTPGAGATIRSTDSGGIHHQHLIEEGIADDYYPLQAEIGYAPDAIAKLRVDPDGNLSVRAPVLTDEGGYYTSFPGSSLPAEITGSAGTGQTITVLNSQCIITAGTTISAEGYITILADYLPVYGEVRLTISQRIANQDIYLELANGATPASDTEFARLHWQGTDPLKTRCETQSSTDTNGNEGTAEDLDQTTTANATTYRIELVPSGASFFYDNVRLTTRKNERVGPYTEMYLRVRVKNGGSAPSSSTTITIDWLDFSNVNRLEVGTSFGTEPIQAAINEDNNAVTQGLDAPWEIQGNKTNNGAVPGATNVGVLAGVVHATPPTYTDGNQAAPSLTTGGDTRVTLDGEQVTVTATNLDIRDLSSASDSITVAATDLDIRNLASGQDSVAAVSAGDVAHDSPDSGNPVKVGAKVETTPSTATLAADGDRTDLLADADGAGYRKTVAYSDIISERVSDTGGTSTAFTNFGATANTRNYVRGYSVFNASATDGFLDFRDGTGGSVLWTIPLPKGGGANIMCSEPIFRTTANTALAYDVSAALTTVYISVTGFKSKV